MKTLVVIPARGGSKGVPNKNIKLLNGKPLIGYTIDVARSLFKDEDICVSTDSEKIAQVAENCGLKVPFLRPPELATDTSSTYDVLLHAIDYYKGIGKKYDIVLLLQPTSPFRKKEDIVAAMNLYTPQFDMVVSVTETKANPYFVLFEENEQGYLEKSKPGHFTSRQMCPKVWQYNGAVYVINVESLLLQSHLTFKKIKKYVMDEYSSVDIDSPLDWDFAEFLLKNR